MLSSLAIHQQGIVPKGTHPSGKSHTFSINPYVLAPLLLVVIGPILPTFAYNDTLGWVHLLGVDDPMHFIAMTPACFLLWNEADLTIHSRLGAIFDLVQFGESLYHNPFGDKDLQVRATGQQMLRELHTSLHVCQQLLQLCLLQLQGVFFLTVNVFQLLQQPVPCSSIALMYPSEKVRISAATAST